MKNAPLTQQIQREKAKPKGEIKFKLTLTEEQKDAKRLVLENDVTFIVGEAASGKTQTAVMTALDMLFKKEVSQIFISRPVLKSNIGFLPGSMEEKMEYMILPIKQCLYQCATAEKVDSLFSDKKIQIIPIEFMKGMTFLDSITIIDEFEDITFSDFRLILTRLGKDSKLIFTGSKQQVSNQLGTKSCIYDIEKLKDSGLVGYKELTSNHRNGSIFKIIKYLEEAQSA